MADEVKTLRSTNTQSNASNLSARGIRTLRSKGATVPTGPKPESFVYVPDYRLGNIDINKDPVRGFTGKRYTVYFDLRNGENVVIPAAKVNYLGIGKELTDEEAIKQYKESGQYYGKFKPLTQEQELTDYLHELELDAQKFRLKNGIEKYDLDDMFAEEQSKRHDGKETDERKPFSTMTAEKRGITLLEASTRPEEDPISTMMAEKRGITLPEASARPEEDPIALKAEAHESLLFDRDVERMRELYGESSDSAFGTLGLAASSGLSNFESGFSNAIFGTAELISGKENAAHRNSLRMNDALQQVAAEERAEMSAAQGVVFDLTQSFAQNAPSMALSVAGGGILGSALTFASTYGNELHYAQKAGADTKTAVTYAFLDGLTQAFLDYVGYLPGAKTITKGAANALSKNISSATLKYIGRVGANMVGEGMTEAFQTSIENGLRNAALGEQNEVGIFTEEALYAAFLGALSAGTMDGISTTAEAVANRAAITKIGNDYLNKNKVGEALKIGLSNAKSSETYRTAQNLEKKFNNNETISAYELGKMVADSQTEKAILAREIERFALESASAHNVDAEIAEQVATVAARLGRPVVFDSAENMKTVGKDGQVYYESGRYDRNTGTITLNAAARSEDLVNYVLKHELAHSVERTKLGQQLEQIVRSSMGAEFDTAVQAKLQEYQNYGKKLDDPGARHEVVAQWLGKNLYQNGFAQAVVNGDAKVGNVILCTLDQVRLALGGTQKSRTAANIAIVERLFMRALQQSPALDNSGGVQYSLGNLPQKNNNNTQNSDISEETMYNNKWASYELTAEFVTKVPYDERHTFLRSLANKTNGMKQGECKSIIIFTDKHVYFYEATGYMDGSIEEVLSVGSKKVKAKIKAWGDISGSSDTGTTTFDSMAQSYESRRGRDGWDNATNGYTGETGQIDDVDEPTQRGDSFGYNWESDGDFSESQELIAGSLVYTGDGHAYKVHEDGRIEEIEISNMNAEYANENNFKRSPPSQDGAGFFDAQNGTQSSFEGSDDIAEAVALMERERAEQGAAPVEENDTLPLSRQTPTAPLTRGAEGEIQQGDVETAPATNIPSPLESERVSEGTVSQAQTVDELTAEIGDEAVYRRMYYAAQIDRPPATLEIDGQTVNTTAYMDELYTMLPDDDLQLTAYLKEREAEKAAQVKERFARGETEAEWTEVDLQILTARSKLEWSELGDSGESGSKMRRFYEQRLKGRDVNKAHETELLELLAGRSETYSPIANAKTLEKAQNKLRNAEYQTALRKRILRYKPNDLFNAVDAAAAQIMINDARNDGDLELYADLVQGLSRKGTELGRAVQVLSMQRRMTPEGTLKAAQRTLRSQADRAMYDGANEDLDVFAERIIDAIERAAESKASTIGNDVQQGGETVHTPMTRDELTEALAQDITGDNSPYITADEIRGILERAVESASDIPEQLKNYLKKNLGSDMGTLAQRIAKLHEAGHLNDMTMRRVMEETLGLPTLTDADVETLTDLVNALNDAPDESVQQLEAMENIYRFLGEKLIVTKLDTLQAWRKFGMLLNAKTHLRNIGSNAVFAGVDRMDSATATVLEHWLSKYLDPKDRTAAFGWSFTEQGRQIRPIVEKSAEQALLRMRGQGQKYEISNGVLNQYRKAFGKSKAGELVNKVNDWNSQLLEKEDSRFFVPAYTNALGQIMVARGLTEVNPEVESIAYKRALEAVFRGENTMTDVLSSVKRYQNSNNKGQALFGFAVDVAIPFSKTPANIAYQAVEHSPIGLVKGAYDIVQVTRGKSAKSMAEAINLVSKGVTGSVLLGIGMLLGSAGLFVTGFGKTEKERAADELAGIQENAFRFGNVTISLDWLQPAASPLIVGASIAQRLKEDGLSLGSVFGAIFDGTDSLFETTMLQSLYDVLGGYEAGASASVASVAENLLSQSVPTVVGQFARAADPVQRKTNGESALSPIIGNGTFAKIIQKVMARIPGLTYLLEPELDVWGNTVYRTGKASTMSGVLNALQQFILPANIKIATGDDEISQIVMALYESDEEQTSRALPTAITREKAAELGVSYEDANRLLGQNQYTALLALLQDRQKYTVTHETTRGGKTVKQKRQKYWSDMTDEERLQVLKKVYQEEKDKVTDPDGEYYEEIIRRMS